MGQEPTNRMTIPLSQLNTWSSQGATVTSATTYATVKKALEDLNANYPDRKFDVFLQGSYGNDTNIRAESDVDVVIRYYGAFYDDIEERPADEQAAFHAAYPVKHKYVWKDFKEHVTQTLRSNFGDSVKPGTKAITIEASGNRRKADVIVAFEFHRYYKFKSIYDERHETGMCFFLKDGTRVANYPALHSQNLTIKNKSTSGNFKPMIRVFKNARPKMIEDGLIAEGSAPSYYIEGLLYNVPDDGFVGDYQDIFLNILNWLYKTQDRTKFECANGQYYLLRDNSHTCWPCADGAKFIDGVIKLWNDWGK
jgi:hypothetical protein